MPNVSGERFKNFKAVGQDEHCYVIRHPNGKKLTVEKSKLSPAAHKEILHLYRGAQVEGDSTGSAPSPGGDSGSFLTRAYNALDNALMLPDEREAAQNRAKADEAAAYFEKNPGPSVPLSQAPASYKPGQMVNPGDEMAPDRPNGFTRTSGMLGPKDQAALDQIKAEEGPVSGDPDYVEKGPSQEQAVSRAQAAAQGRGPNADPLLVQKAGQQDLLAQQIKQQEDALAAGQASGNEVAQIQQQQADALAKLPSFNDLVAKYQAKDAKLFQDAADSKIDPQHLVHSMSTGSKLLTGVGMVISGMGAGLAGQPIGALQVINDAIKRDVDAQKDDQTKKMNLWKMNREVMGSDMAANLATENQIKSTVLARLQAAQTRAQLPQEKLRAQMAIDQIKQEMLQNNLRRGLLVQGTQGAQGGNGLSIADPSMLVPEMVKDPGQQKQVYEEIKNRANIAKNGANMLKAFDQAAQEVSGMGGVIHSAIEKTPGQLQLEQLMKPNMSELDGTIRHEAVVGANETMIPSFKDFGRTDRLAAKRQSLIDWMKSQSSTPVSKGNYIDLDRFQGTAIPGLSSNELPPAKTVMGGGKAATPQTIERKAKDGRIIIYDAKTKQPIGVKK